MWSGCGYATKRHPSSRADSASDAEKLAGMFATTAIPARCSPRPRSRASRLDRLRRARVGPECVRRRPLRWRVRILPVGRRARPWRRGSSRGSRRGDRCGWSRRRRFPRAPSPRSPPPPRRSTPSSSSPPTTSSPRWRPPAPDASSSSFTLLVPLLPAPRAHLERTSLQARRRRRLHQDRPHERRHVHRLRRRLRSHRIPRRSCSSRTDDPWTEDGTHRHGAGDEIRGVKDAGPLAALAPAPQVGLVLSPAQVDAALDDLGFVRDALEGLPEETRQAAAERLRAVETALAKRAL